MHHNYQIQAEGHFYVHHNYQIQAVGQLYVQHNYQIKAVEHWCYSSMCIITIRYRQWNTGVTVLCASQLSDTGSGTVLCAT